MKFRIVLRTISVSLFALLAGCNPPQPLNFSVQNVQPSNTRVEADLRSITVTPAAPDERTGELPPAVANLAPTWKEATQEALSRTGLFDDNSQRHLNLEVKILRFDAPSVGINFTTETEARYSLVDRATGGIIFSKTISGHGSTPGDFSLVGAIRARESINRSVQSNIEAFVKTVESDAIAVPRLQRPTS